MGDYRNRIYERYASAFKDESQAFNASAAAWFAKRYTHHLRGWLPADPNAAVLDLACGSGRMLYMLKGLGFKRIAGVDISPEQVRLAKQVVDRVTQADILTFLADQEAAYDLITGIDIIEHFDKDQVFTFLDGCYRALKPGGRLVLHTPNADTPWVNQIRYGDFTHEVCFTSNALSRVMGLCGFERVEPREVTPLPAGFGGTLRYALWRVLRLKMKLWNWIEVGSPGSGVYTRVFLISGVKPG